MMVASKAADVEYAQAQRELPRMRGFEEELVLSVARRRATRQTIAPPAVRKLMKEAGHIAAGKLLEQKCQQLSPVHLCAQGKYTFRQYEVLGPAALGVPVDEGAKLQPPSEAALALLHRLAADPGIVGIMNKHKWSVGILKEMPPEGKVCQICPRALLLPSPSQLKRLGREPSPAPRLPDQCSLEQLTYTSLVSLCPTA